MKLSSRANRTSASPLRSLVNPTDSTIHIHRLNIGQPDIHSPKEFFDGVRNFTSPVVAYDTSVGNKALLHEWTSLFNRQYQIDITPQQMLITSGSSEALMFVFSICCDVNDDVLVFSPSYANYTGFAAIAGVNLVPVQCSLESGFHIPTSTHDIEAHITPTTKAILLCNPNNPTGTVFTHQELQTIINLCEKHDLFLIVDEVYREFVYEGVPSSIFQVSPKNPRIIVIDSVSKRYSLCGARIGCLITWNQDVMTSAINFASTRVSAPSIEQEATAYMLKHISDDYLTDVVHEYKLRRNTLVTALKAIEGVEFGVPEGGFYILVKLPVDDAQDFAQFMLQSFSQNHETVCVSPASGFFLNNTPATNYVRMAFVVSAPELYRAAKIIENALVLYTTRLPKI